MNSPFPGMDPYLERHWRDVHGTLIVHARASLQEQLGGALRARIEERLIVESPLDESREIYPDVRVFERGLNERPVTPTQGTVLAEPVVVRHATEKARQRFIEIIDAASGGRLVTVIEFVSPSNKLPGEGRAKYLHKQAEVIDAAINLVEIDLTRSGRRELSFPDANLTPELKSTYFACVYRGHGADQHELYAISLRQRLPAIRVPLRPQDADVVLDLQPLIERAYAEGRYDDIDYAAPCVSPITPPDAQWADELLQSARRP